MRTLFIVSKRDFILAISLMLFIISLAIVLTTFFKPLYYFDIEYLDIAGYSRDVLKENYSALIDYQKIWNRSALYLPDFPMSISGRIHFKEVKDIFDMVQLVLISSGVVSIGLMIKNIKDKEFEFLRLTAFLTLFIPGCIAFLASANFSKAFEIFHKIFFRNNYWIFNPRTDPIITVLPETFFMHCFIMIVLLVMLGSGICYCVYKYQQKVILKG